MHQRQNKGSLDAAYVLWRLLCVSLLLGFTGCSAAYKRGTAVPEDLGDFAKIPGVTRAREWGDEPPTHMKAWLHSSREELKEDYAGIMDTEHAYLAISGGGRKPVSAPNSPWSRELARAHCQQ